MLYAPNLVAAQQELLTAAPLKASQPALYQAVRNKLKNWKLTDKQIDQIEQDGTAKETFPVYANVSGTVTELLTSEGDFVKAGQPIARLSNLGTVWAELDAYESQLDQFRIGQQLSLTTKAYPDLKLEARISFIDPVLDQNKRTVTIRATLQNREGFLKPGMFVWANIPSKTGTREVPLTIPASAVMWTGKRSLVYVKEHPDQPVFAMREVTLGSRTADSFVVVSGLEAGEEIVTNGTFTVDAAAQLQGKKSMMNQRSSEEDFIVIDPLDEEFVAQLKVSAQSYFELKDALVDSDQEAAVKIASKMAENLRKIDTDTRADQEEALQNMREHLTALEAASSIDQQRVHFQRISEALISMARPLGSADQPIYLQYCPMANQNKGAYWLSLESDIKNPYYGEAMLRCGEVRATWLGER
jgi:Cu(I)/Ag(I) efflux system membrane fusion protein